MDDNNETITFYNKNASEYFQTTMQADMSDVYEKFLFHVRPGGRIIDLGAGSGRDIARFKEKGYSVDAIDASAELCKLASDYSGIEVKCQRIQEWDPDDVYDGIWANASLLHLAPEEMKAFLKRVGRYMSDTGVLFCSLKSGIKTGPDENGRFFVNYSIEKIENLVETGTGLSVVEWWNRSDSLGRTGFSWLNVILGKK